MKSTPCLMVSGLLWVASLATAASADNIDSLAGSWKTSLVIDVTTTQTAYSDSWVGGEAGSINWVSNLNGTAEKQLATWMNYHTTLKLSFGQTLTQDANTNTWSKPHKSTDLIDWEHVGRLTFNSVFDPFAAFRLESQFQDASFEPKKRMLTPLKLTESAGFAREFYKAKNNRLLSRLGLALRQTIRNVVIDSALSSTTDSTLTDGGIESVTDATFEFNERLSYTGKLTLYKALFFSGSDQVKGTPFENDWKAVDVNWENILNAAVTRIVTVNLYAQFLYDKQISRRGRIKETVGVGFAVRLM